ncbi:hypothetical protein DIPPA_08448 [Diplonema papillatum]|nr:hypothetical protein DIPPA_08448 [Diplonema papillatum]
MTVGVECCAMAPDDACGSPEPFKRVKDPDTPAATRGRARHRSPHVAVLSDTLNFEVSVLTEAGDEGGPACAGCAQLLSEKAALQAHAKRLVLELAHLKASIVGDLMALRGGRQNAGFFGRTECVERPFKSAWEAGAKPADNDMAGSIRCAAADAEYSSGSDRSRSMDSVSSVPASSIASSAGVFSPQLDRSILALVNNGLSPCAAAAPPRPSRPSEPAAAVAAPALPPVPQREAPAKPRGADEAAPAYEAGSVLPGRSSSEGNEPSVCSGSKRSATPPIAPQRSSNTGPPQRRGLCTLDAVPIQNTRCPSLTRRTPSPARAEASPTDTSVRPICTGPDEPFSASQLNEVQPAGEPRHLERCKEAGVVDVKEAIKRRMASFAGAEDPPAPPASVDDELAALRAARASLRAVASRSNSREKGGRTTALFVSDAYRRAASCSSSTPGDPEGDGGGGTGAGPASTSPRAHPPHPSGGEVCTELNELAARTPPADGREDPGRSVKRAADSQSCPDAFPLCISSGGQRAASKKCGTQREGDGRMKDDVAVAECAEVKGSEVLLSGECDAENPPVLWLRAPTQSPDVPVWTNAVRREEAGTGVAGPVSGSILPSLEEIAGGAGASGHWRFPAVSASVSSCRSYPYTVRLPSVSTVASRAASNSSSHHCEQNEGAGCPRAQTPSPLPARMASPSVTTQCAVGVTAVLNFGRARLSSNSQHDAASAGARGGSAGGRSASCSPAPDARPESHRAKAPSAGLDKSEADGATIRPADATAISPAYLSNVAAMQGEEAKPGKCSTLMTGEYRPPDDPTVAHPVELVLLSEAASEEAENLCAKQVRRLKGVASACLAKAVGTVRWSNGGVYAVFERPRGAVTLAEYARRRRAAGSPFTCAEALALAGKLARGVADLHAAGVLHRELTSSGIWLDAGPQVTSSTAVAFRRYGVARGPKPGGGESDEARAFSKESDVRAVGVVLCELVTYNEPHRAVASAGGRSAVARPSTCPEALWQAAIGPCLGPAPSRPTAAGLVAGIANNLCRGDVDIPFARAELPAAIRRRI